MATTSNNLAASAASAATATTTTTRPFSATATTAAAAAAAKSPSRPQTHHASPFPLYHYYASQNIQIRPQTQTKTQISNPISSSQQQQGILYPVASSGRGFIPRPVRPADQTVTVANNQNLTSGAYHPRAVGVAYRPPIGSGSGPASGTSPGCPRSHPHMDSGLAHIPHPSFHHPVHMIRQHPPHLQHQQQQHYIGGSAGAGLAPIKGIPVTGQLKAASSPLPDSDSNVYKTLRDRSRDDTLTIVRDRKPHYGDVVKSLPRPLPMPVLGTHSPNKEDEEEVEDNDKDEQSFDHLSTQDLLKRHIQRAKKVRARLREGRLKRIARYKTRLALLLPPQVEQFRNDTAAGN
ncbi:uncharacterized protein LOC110623917 isoform X2 [Manihot esculenta]|uniref:uncharacterized protein LOC110623917 isoform X2 n=1 Tax=Manihot esculenta TaxID=3983 RepID=UPI001CC4AE5D|nr:uncharacterized protein LOC110623917 isoform X2 [Manihot esculenta]